MKKIISDYLREHRWLPIRWWLVTALDAAGLLLSHSFTKDSTRVAAFVCTAGLATAALWSTLDVLVAAPGRFKKRLNALPENERNAVSEQYENAAAIGKRYFLKEFLIFYFRADIVLVRFSEIRSAELKGYKLLLDTGGKKPLKMPFEPDENPAMLVAALRSKNPQISVKLNGQIIEKMENRKDSTE